MKALHDDVQVPGAPHDDLQTQPAHSGCCLLYSTNNRKQGCLQHMRLAPCPQLFHLLQQHADELDAGAVSLSRQAGEASLALQLPATLQRGK